MEKVLEELTLDYYTMHTHTQLPDTLSKKPAGKYLVASAIYVQE